MELLKTITFTFRIALGVILFLVLLPLTGFQALFLAIGSLLLCKNLFLYSSPISTLALNEIVEK